MSQKNAQEANIGILDLDNDDICNIHALAINIFIVLYESIQADDKMIVSIEKIKSLLKCYYDNNS